MKFSQKIFLITFAFVIITIELIGIIIINNNYNTQINSKMEKNIANIETISSTLNFYNTLDISGTVLTSNKTYYEISDKDNIIYSNIIMDIEDIRNKITPTENEIKSLITSGNLFMSAKIGENNIILVENIADIIEIRKNQIDFFIKVSIIASFIIAFFLYFIIYLLTRRINKLNKTVEKISNGDFSTRVVNLGNDEVGALGKSFNIMADSIENTIEEIQTVSENRKNFINNITHEIRTPLTSIIGYSSLIKNKKINDEEKIFEYNEKIYEEGTYLNLLSQRLMEIVLLNNKEIKLENINVSETIENILENIKFNYTDIEINKKIEDNICFKSDKTLIQSLLYNLTKNSIMSYSNDRKKYIQIEFKKLSENKVLLEVKDNGKGIEENQLQKITEPFYTLSKDRNRKISGMGLGLPICMKMCGVLKAEMKIKSQVGVGTTVSIEFEI